MHLPRNAHFKVHTAPATKFALQGPQSTATTKFAPQGPRSTAPATKSTLQGPQSTAPAARFAFRPTKYCASRSTKYSACHEICTSRSTTYCACHNICTSRSTKSCACHEICISMSAKYCACNEICASRRTAHCTCHDFTCPKVTIHCQSMAKTPTKSKVLRLPQNLHIDIKLLCTCHEKSTLDKQATRRPLRLPRKVVAKSKNAHSAPTRAHLRQAPRGQRFGDPTERICIWRSQNEPAQPKRTRSERTLIEPGPFTPTVRTPQDTLCGNSDTARNLIVQDHPKSFFVGGAKILAAQYTPHTKRLGRNQCLGPLLG